MSTPSKIDIINVTVDVYDSAEAKAHYDQELARGLYSPMIWVRWTNVRGQKRLAYSVCRQVLNTDDRVLVNDLVNQQIEQKRVVRYPLYDKASVFDLFTIRNGTLSPAVIP